MKQVAALAVAFTLATSVQSANVWPKVNIPYNFQVKLDYYQWDPSQQIVNDLHTHRITKMSSELNLIYDEYTISTPGQEFTRISAFNYNTGESPSYQSIDSCTKDQVSVDLGYVALQIFGMYNPYSNQNHSMDFVGKETPAWDSNNTYYRLNLWSNDHTTLERWIYYRMDTGDVAWEVQPDFEAKTDKLFLYKFGQGYIPTHFQDSDFKIQQCSRSSLFLQ